ncbi:hypothetical protein ACKWTF_014517 [Chironomus riparius]
MDFLLSKIPRVYKVCKCCDLKTGNKIFASVLSSFKVLLLIVMWYRLYTLDDTVDTVLTAFEGTAASKVEEKIDYLISLEAIIVLVVILVPTLVCLLFIKGINDVSCKSLKNSLNSLKIPKFQQNTSYMLPYIYMYTIPAIQILLLAFFSIFLIFFYISFIHHIVLLVIVAALLGAAVAYVPICAYSLYREIEEGKMQNLEGVATDGYVS